MSALIVRDDSKLSISFTPEAQQQKANALALSGVIGRVTNADENARAVEAQAALNAIINQTEKARKAVKEPILEYGRKIDDAAKKFIAEAKEEFLRVSALAGDFAALEQAKLKAAERAAREEQTRIERERAEALAKAKSHEALDAINEHFDNKAKDIAPPPAPTRAEGQRITNDWNIVVSDVHALYRFHPNCVKMEPLISEIKNLLNAGQQVKGVTATPIVKAGVRSGKRPALIEV